MRRYQFHFFLILIFLVISTNPLDLYSKLDLFYILIHELSHVTAGALFLTSSQIEIVREGNSVGYSYGRSTYLVVYAAGFLGTPVLMNTLLHIKRISQSHTSLMLLAMYVFSVTLVTGNSTALTIASVCSFFILAVSVSKWMFDYLSDIVLYLIYAIINLYNLLYLVEVALGQRSSIDIARSSELIGILNGQQLAIAWAILSLLLLFAGILIDTLPHSSQDGVFLIQIF